MAALLVAAVGVSACVTSNDPAEGGFFNGVAGLAGGGYDARIAERERGVAEAREEGAALSAELARLEAEHAALARQLRAQEAALRARGVAVPPEVAARAEAAEAVAGDDDAARVAALRRSIADMRALSEQLAALAG